MSRNQLNRYFPSLSLQKNHWLPAAGAWGLHTDSCQMAAVWEPGLLSMKLPVQWSRGELSKIIFIHVRVRLSVICLLLFVTSLVRFLLHLYPFDTRTWNEGNRWHWGMKVQTAIKISQSTQDHCTADSLAITWLCFPVFMLLFFFF